YNIKLLEKYDFNNIVISLKSSDVIMMIEAYRQMSEICDYPLHIGVTEAGTEKMGVIKSSIGIGSLLIDGIGDTIRVSLTEDPVKEVHTGINILKSLNMYRNSINIVSCPTCGRTKIDIINITKQVEEILESQEIAKNIKKNIKVAIMGCVVNGPGEAKDADVGIAGGTKYGVLFKHGQVIKKIPEQDLVSELIQEIKNMIL
ncbi:MAG: flavodoxin-dependent (E)-4-hydroxy-3-methylbut-2-enyl-diphosphate synthase, partial [Clostridia bacterium]|nr:flavodoxin-dependent (E)-4-hydroxy-3-methylbut-2-enyl-diphosphate synthase [Clostridia bacterium]